MNYKRFEDLPVWNAAIDLAVEIYALTEQPQLRSRRSLRDQIERAAVSVSNNIAEGFERGTNNELFVIPLHLARFSRRGQIDAVFARSNSDISNFEQRNCFAQEESGKLLAPIERLGTVASEFGLQGRASRESEGKACD